MSKTLDPFRFFAIITGVVLLLAFVACFAFPLSPPMRGYIVSSPVGYRTHPLGGTALDLHRGVDLVGPAGCEILAAAPGIVLEAGEFAVIGIMVILDHGEGILTLYGHLRHAKVRVGQRVAKGQVLGWQGATGDVTGEHLHFELIIDPLLFFEAPIGPVARDPRELLR